MDTKLPRFITEAQNIRNISRSFNTYPPGFTPIIIETPAKPFTSEKEARISSMFSFLSPREWVNDNRGRYRIMTYNVLADCNINKTMHLYNNIPRELLELDTRAEMIACEISHWNPDLLCLQEVDAGYEYYSTALSGYYSIFQKRTGNFNDGCMVMWKAAKFRMVDRRDVEYRSYNHDLSYILNKGNIATFCLLESSTDPSQAILLISTHILFNKNRGDTQVGQLLTLTKAIKHMKELYHNKYSIGVLLCGDFNLSPCSILYSFLKTGSIDFCSISPKNLSMRTFRDVDSYSDLRSLATQVLKEYIPSYYCNTYMIAQNSRFVQILQNLELEDDGSVIRPTLSPIRKYSHDLVLYNGIILRSVYKDCDEEPFPTMIVRGEFSTVDYIWYDGNVQPTRVLRLPSLHSIAEQKYGPNFTLPSDHLPLVAEFNLI
jgi:mRNA deadenylase 3'-5' endonuclease subunit Ccr4